MLTIIAVVKMRASAVSFDSPRNIDPDQNIAPDPFERDTVRHCALNFADSSLTIHVYVINERIVKVGFATVDGTGWKVLLETLAETLAVNRFAHEELSKANLSRMQCLPMPNELTPHYPFADIRQLQNCCVSYFIVISVT